MGDWVGRKSAWKRRQIEKFLPLLAAHIRSFSSDIRYINLAGPTSYQER
jgi:hypothetical protein